MIYGIYDLWYSWFIIFMIYGICDLWYLWFLVFMIYLQSQTEPLGQRGGRTLLGGALSRHSTWGQILLPPLLLYCSLVFSVTQSNAETKLFSPKRVLPQQWGESSWLRVCRNWSWQEAWAGQGARASPECLRGSHLRPRLGDDGDGDDFTELAKWVFFVSWWWYEVCDEQGGCTECVNSWEKEKTNLFVPKRTPVWAPWCWDPVIGFCLCLACFSTDHSLHKEHSLVGHTQGTLSLWGALWPHVLDTLWGETQDLIDF